MRPRQGRSLVIAAVVLPLLLGVSSCSFHGGSSSGAATTSTDSTPVRHMDSLPGTDITQAGDGAGDVRLVDFSSNALHRADSYLIYLPPGYQSMVSSGARFSVLYMLHGDGNHGNRDAQHLFENG